jgi:hypothetical protein
MVLIDAVILAKATPSSPTQMVSVPMQEPMPQPGALGCVNCVNPTARALGNAVDNKSFLIGMLSSIAGTLIVVLGVRAYQRYRKS